MKHALGSLVVATAVFAAAPAFATDALVRFEGGIGVLPAANVSAAGVPTVNTVQGVPPGGLPWVVRSLKATIAVDGSVSIKGSGLLLAAGNGIGTRGPVTSVGATLFCGGIAFDSPTADLSAAGNFSIKGALTAQPPAPCTTPVLLIRNAAGTRGWFAAGIVGAGDDD